MNSQLNLFNSPADESVSVLDNQNAVSGNAFQFLEGLNEQQQDAVMTPANQALQVLAGAGTGKTELISRRFVKLVKDFRAVNLSRPEERILVVTFTSDAALGMRNRIHQRLIDNREEGLGPDAWISTFHQFCMRLLRAHPLEVGLAPGFAILNSLEQQVLFNRVVQAVLAGEYPDLFAVLRHYGLDAHLPADVLSLQSLQQCGLSDPETFLEPGRVFGLISRIKSAGLSPIEFFKMAVAQSERLTERLKTLPVPHDPDSDKLENMLEKVAAWTQSLAPWAYDDWQPIREADEKAERKGKKLTPGSYKDEVKELAAFYLVPKTFEPQFPDTTPLDEALVLEKTLAGILSAIYALYQERLLQEGACDFDDLINHAIRLLDNNVVIRKRYQNQFEAVIVDEFQDSNGSQLRLLSLLLRERAQNLTVVGDEKQSIYAFRFAQPENLNLIFDGHPHKTVNLQTNYRSYPPILGVANHLTGQITRFPNQTLNASERYAENREPKVTWVNLDEPIEKEDGKTGKKPIAEQKEREARFIAVEVARLAKAGECKFSDVAVLVKSHAKAERIQQALADLNIPSIRQKNLGFFEEPVIKDALALLRLMCDLNNDLALVRILQAKLNQRQLLALMRLKTSIPAIEGKKKPSLFDVCLHFLENPAASPDIPLAVGEALGDLARRLLELRKRKARLAPNQLFLNLAKAVGLISPQTPEWQQKQQRIQLRTFEKLLSLFGQNQPIQPTLDEVLDILDQYAANPNQELPVKEELSGEDAVRIMTVFASKGLEFPVVFVAYTDLARNGGGQDTALIFDPQYEGKAGFGLIAGKVNGLDNLKKEVYQQCWISPRSATEAQRVFYVALTRAMRKLYVLRSDQSPVWTEPDEYPQSWMTVLSETRQAETLQADYWDADAEILRQAMTQLQAKKTLASTSIASH